MKYFVRVKFKGSDKTYGYYTSLNLSIGATYDIVADGRTTYNNPVTILDWCYATDNNPRFRTITSAKLVDGLARPDDGLNKVIFDEAAGVTVALWKDGTKTIIRCQKGDVFDKEKAIALCYMKKALGNRGSFNETLKKWTK